MIITVNRHEVDIKSDKRRGDYKMFPVLTEKQRNDLDIVKKIIRKDYDNNNKIKEENLKKKKSEPKDLLLP